MPPTQIEVPPDVEAGQAVYSRRVLAFYDLLVHGFSNPLVWKCPTRRILDLYDAHVTANHLEVGVGTGYLLDRCRFPSATPRLALVDLNENCLRATTRRLARYRPVALRANVFEPISYDGPQFESAGMTYLLHCLPGDMCSKTSAFEHVAKLLAPGGVVFGATLLSEGVPRGFLARRLMRIYNRRGIFANEQDSLSDLEEALSSRFASFDVESAGCAALFRATVAASE